MGQERELSKRRSNVQSSLSPVPQGTLLCQLYHCIGPTVRQRSGTGMIKYPQQSGSCSGEGASPKNKGAMSL